MGIKEFELERYFAKYEFSARWILGASDPESMSVAELLDMEPGSRERLESLWLGYTEAPGDPALRKIIAAGSRRIDAADVLMFTGSEEPIYTFMSAVLEPGDHLVVHAPSYQSHISVAEARGIAVTLWRGDPARGWAPDLSELPKLLRPETRAILVCTPHNPTGWLASHSEWEALVEVARSRGLWLFADEVYRGLEHDPAQRLPQACDLYDKAVSLGGLSKNCGLAGLRMGWVATKDKAVLARMAAYKDYLTICNSAPSEFMAMIALRNAEKLYVRSRKRAVANLDLLEAFFLRHKDLFRWERPRAGTTTFPEYLGGDSEDFCARLVEETGVLLVPGRFFGDTGQSIRFGYGRKNFPEALGILEKWLGT